MRVLPSPRNFLSHSPPSTIAPFFRAAPRPDAAQVFAFLGQSALSYLDI